MSKIAVIDTGINAKNLHCNSFTYYNLTGKKNARRNFEKSHGTLCSRILDYCIQDYDLINIQIMLSARNYFTKDANISTLQNALKLCLELKPDIIALSLASKNLMDSKELFELTKENAVQSIVVAALDNHRYISLPASYPFVIGVQTDRANLLRAGEVCYRAEDLYYAPVYANCNFDFLREENIKQSNSFSVPVVVAQIDRWLKEKKDVWKELSNLKPYTITPEKEEQYLNPPRFGEYVPPVVMLVVKEKKTEQAYSMMVAMMDELYKKHDYCVASVCTFAGEYDIRIRQQENKYKIAEEIEFVQNNYKTNLVFLLTDEELPTLKEDKIDITIYIYEAHYLAKYEGMQSEGKLETLEEDILEIFAKYGN